MTLYNQVQSVTSHDKHYHRFCKFQFRTVETVEISMRDRVIGGVWEKSPRFEEKTPVHRRGFSGIERSRMSEIRTRNKNMSLHTPQQKAALQKYKAVKKSIIQSKNSVTRRLSYFADKQSKADSFQRKFELFRLRQKKPRKIKNSWGVLASVIGMTLILNLKFKYMKDLKKRNKRRVGFFARIILCIVKFNSVLRAFRYKRSLIVITSIVPRIKFLHLRKKQTNRHILLNILDSYFVKTKLFHIMAKFKLILMFAQRKTREKIRVKRTRIETLNKLWNKLEIQKIKSSKSFRLEKPIEMIKQRFLKKFYDKQLRIYFKEYNRYKKEYDLVQAQWKSQQKEARIHFEITGIQERLTPPKFPNMPCFVLYSKQKLLNEYIRRAVKSSRTSKIITFKLNPEFTPNRLISLVFGYIMRRILLRKANNSYTN